MGVQNVCTVELMRARSRLGQFESFLSPSQLRFFVDASGFQLFLNLDLRPLLQMAKASDNYFAERVYKVYVPRIAGWLASPFRLTILAIPGDVRPGQVINLSKFGQSKK